VSLAKETTGKRRDKKGIVKNRIFIHFTLITSLRSGDEPHHFLSHMTV
jgi:hypothetical protein